jgi:hypothetical protein
MIAFVPTKRSGGALDGSPDKAGGGGPKKVANFQLPIVD